MLVVVLEIRSSDSRRLVPDSQFDSFPWDPVHHCCRMVARMKVSTMVVTVMMLDTDPVDDSTTNIWSVERSDCWMWWRHGIDNPRPPCGNDDHNDAADDDHIEEDAS